MEISTRQKLIRKLAEQDDPNVSLLFDREVRNIREILENSNDYAALESSLELLDEFAFRVPSTAMQIVEDFAERVERIGLVLDGESISKTWLSNYYSGAALVCKAIGSMRNIRFLDISRTLQFFLKYSQHKNDDVRNKAHSAIGAIAEYNMDIVYGTATAPAYGPAAQIELLKCINEFSKEEMLQHFSEILSICEKLLSPNISSTSSTSTTVTWHLAHIGADDAFRKVRIETLNHLKMAFKLADGVSQQLQVLRSLQYAFQLPTRGAYSDGLQSLVCQNSLEVLDFYKETLTGLDMQCLQKIEHDTYWLVYRSNNDEIIKSGLEIRDALNGIEEYQIFKILIGYEGIFEDWEKPDASLRDHDSQDRYRRDKITELVNSVTPKNHDVWLKRICDYSSIESNDLATFPYFSRFLESLAAEQPAVALQIIEEEPERTARFLVPILLGLLVSTPDTALGVIRKNLDAGTNIWACARVFEFAPSLDEDTLLRIYDIALNTEASDVLLQLLGAACEKFVESEDFCRQMVVNCIRSLGDLVNTDWVNVFWFRKHRKSILNTFNQDEIQALLDSLVKTESIDFHAEEVLALVADRYPERVTDFFGERVRAKQRLDSHSNYDSIPFGLSRLSEPLSAFPERLVSAVREWYEGDYSLFIYEGANFLKIVFPEFPQTLEHELVKFVQSSSIQDVEFVLAVLRNYEGNDFLHPICKELVVRLSGENSLLSEVAVILSNTGVVTGEYGFVNALKSKAQKFGEWFEDDRQEVRDFAQRQIDEYQARIEYETATAKEQIVLRKFHYGEE